MFELQVTVGGVVSTTATMKLQLVVTPALLRAVQTTLDSPSRKPVPEGGTQVTISGPPHRLLDLLLATGLDTLITVDPAL